MSENVFGQCATLIGRAAIQESLLVVPTPTEDDVGKVLTAEEDNAVKWKALPKLEEFGATDALTALTEVGFITPAQQNGIFYTSPTGEIYTI